MTKKAIFVDGEHNPHTEEIEQCMRDDRFEVEHINIAEFHTIASHPQELKSSNTVLFIPLDNQVASQVAKNLLEEEKIPTVGYVHEADAHLAKPSPTMALLKHSDAVERSQIYAAVAKAKTLASSMDIAAQIEPQSLHRK